MANMVNLETVHNSYGQHRADALFAAPSAYCGINKGSIIITGAVRSMGVSLRNVEWAPARCGYGWMVLRPRLQRIADRHRDERHRSSSDEAEVR